MKNVGSIDRGAETPAPAEVDASSARALVMDDEVVVAATIRKLLEREGLECMVAHTSREALDLLRTQTFDLVFADVIMPGVSGMEVAKVAKSRDPAVQVIIVTGSTDTETAVAAIRAQADDYLLKPVEAGQLSHSVRRALEHRRLLRENERYREGLEERVRQQAHRMERMYLASIHSLVSALEAKDPHTAGHSTRVAHYATVLGERLGGVDLESLGLGARLHDIGKIGVPDRVLGKRGPLTDLEAERVQEHPTVGVWILKPVLADEVALGVVRSHHERWDGRGYPERLAGPDIPLAARVVSVADTLDAMTTVRPYRSARAWAAALQELGRCAGTQFDPDIANAALDVFSDQRLVLEAS